MAALLNINVSSAEQDAILAGLRMLMQARDSGTVTPNDGDIGDILTCGGDHAGLDAEDIDALCMRINCGK